MNQRNSHSRLEIEKTTLADLWFAEREKCDRFLTTISIPDPKCETFFNWQINPTPIGTDEGSVIIAHKTSFTKIFTRDDRGKYKFEINFKVSEKRPHLDITEVDE